MLRTGLNTFIIALLTLDSSGADHEQNRWQTEDGYVSQVMCMCQLPACPGRLASVRTMLSKNRGVCLRRKCTTLKVRQRPRAQEVLKMDHMLAHCVNINKAAACLRYLDLNESDYMSTGIAGNDEESPLVWTSRQTISQPMLAHYDSLAPMFYHTLVADLAFDRVDVMVASFLYSQPLERSLLVLWFISETEMTQFAKHTDHSLHPNVKLKLFEHNDILAQLHPESMDLASSKAEKTALSDQIRIVLLIQYGGIWLDSDTVFLRDLSPLWPYEFAGRWSFLPSHNNAILRLFPASKLGQALWKQAILSKEKGMQPQYFAKLLNGTKHRLLALPSPLVDPVWLAADNIPQEHEMGEFSFRSRAAFFEQPPNTDADLSGKVFCSDGVLRFFEGAFTYHWSSGWDNNRNDEGTYFQALKGILAGFISGRTPNRYGEMLCQ